MLYPIVVQSLEEYSHDRVRELVSNTMALADILRQRVPEYITETEVTVQVPGDAVLAQSVDLDQIDHAIVPYEATAALAMLLLREHGILTVHFAGLPPGTSSLLFKFLPSETVRAFGGHEALAEAIVRTLKRLPDTLSNPESLRKLLYEYERGSFSAV